MRNTAKKTTIALSMATMLMGAGLTVQVAHAATAESIAKGKEVSWNRKTGNCLACHMMPGGVSPGDLGPPLVAMKARFPDRQKLFDQIYDATAINPSSRMPPFGKYGALSKSDIDAIVDYLYTL